MYGGGDGVDCVCGEVGAEVETLWKSGVSRVLSCKNVLA